MLNYEHGVDFGVKGFRRIDTFFNILNLYATFARFLYFVNL